MPKATQHPTPKVRPARAKPPQKAGKQKDVDNAACAATTFKADPWTAIAT